MSFAGLFPELDYRHHLSVKRGDLARFFARTDDTIIRERGRWLSESPEKYAGALEGSERFIDEAAFLLNSPNGEASAEGETARPFSGSHSCLPPARRNSATACARMIALGVTFEPDIVLLEKQDDGIFRIVAGCVCFPSSWDFAEKLGKPLDLVHEVVPDLNSSLGGPIARFLEKIQPGNSWERSNWGLSASPERNQHPSRGIPQLTSPISLERVWMRVEDQILSILPETRALLFGIRIVTISLDELLRKEPAIVANFRRALTSMPEPMARYKNLLQVRDELVALLA